MDLHPNAVIDCGFFGTTPAIGTAPARLGSIRMRPAAFEKGAAETMRILMTIAVALGVSACGTVTRGTNEDVTFNSNPPGAKVQTSTGLVRQATPCTFPINRKQEFIATFELEGHHSQQISVTTGVSGGGAAGMAGNVLIGGVVGIVVDASTGATLDHSPNPVFATMAPMHKSRPTAKPRRSRKAAGPEA